MSSKALPAPAKHLFRCLFEQASLGIAVEDLEGKLLLANPALCSMLGYTEMELCRMSCSEFANPEDSQEDWALFQQLRSGIIDHYSLEKRYVRKDGALLWGRLNVSLLKDEHGESPLVFAFVENITERKRAIQAISESEERLRLAAQAGNVYAYEWDPTTDLVTRSEEYANILGLIDPGEQLTRQKVASRVHPDDRARFISSVDDLTPEHPTTQISYRMLRPDGSLVWLEKSGRAFFDAQGRLLRVMGMVADITERRRAEERLREYEKAVEGSEDMIAVVDREYRYLIANRKFLKLRNLTKEQVVGRPVPEVLNKGIFEEVVKEKLDECFAGKVVKFEMRYTYPELGERDLFVSYFPIKGAARVDRAVCILQDVTERKQVEEALKKSEEKFSKAFQQGPMALTLTSAKDHRYIDVNEAFEQLTGWRRDEVIGRTPIDIGIWADSTRRLEFAKRVLAEGAIRGWEVQYRSKDGTQRVGLGAGELIHIGNEPCILSVIADITERKRVEEALRASEERLRLAQQAACIGTFDWNIRTGVNTWTPELEAMYGLPPGGFGETQTAFENLVHPDDRAGVIKLVDAAMKSGQPTKGEWRVVWADGSVHWIAGRWQVFMDASSKPSKMIGVNIDITERKQAEEALKRSELNYRLFVAQSSEGIFCQELEHPIPVDLPEDEQVQRILHESYLAECNDALARMYGMSPADFVGKKLTETLDAENAVNIELTRDYIRGGYRVVDRESHEVDRQGNPKVFLHSMIGIVENGMLLRTWGIQRDVTDRRQAEQARAHAEQALRESEQRFRLATQAGKMYAYEWDVASDKVVRSEEYVNVLGFDDQPKQLTRQQLLARVHADDRELFASSVDKLSPENPTIQISYRLSRPDGSVVWLEKSARAFFDEQDRMLSVTGIVADITERKRAEQALRESEARERARVKELETILDAVPVPVRIAHDAACRWMTGNLAAYKLADVPVGRNVSSSAPPAEGPRYRLMEDGVQVAADMLPMQQAAATGKPVYGRALTVVYENGTKRETVENAVPLLDEAGKPRGAVGTSIDLTEQKEAEDKFRLLLDSTAEAIYGIDLEHRCTFCNPACLRALGYERIDEVLGKNMHNLIHHTRADGTQFPVDECRVHRVTRTGEGAHAEDEVLWRANGTSFPAEYWSYPQRRGHEVVGAVVAFTDITDRKLAEAALANVSRKLIEAQEQERSRIGRELHDDIGQRLALLAVELQQLRDKSVTLPQVRRRVSKLQKRTSEIAADVQSLSHELHSARLQYLGITAAVRGFCREFAKQQKVEIDFKSHDLPIRLPADVSLCLFRVLQEALHNSAKHSGVRHFEVRLWGTADEIHLTVSDSGAGVDFEAARTSRGLGLISMEERLKALNGTLSVESLLKRGTTIHARAPLRSAVDSMRAAG